MQDFPYAYLEGDGMSEQLPDLVAVRNAARDVAKAMQRFDRDIARFQRLGRQALADHGEAAVTGAVQEAVKGHPQLADHLRRLAEKLA